MTPIILVAAVIGAVWGSFLNVLIHRLPGVGALGISGGGDDRGYSYIALPRSFCPACSEPIKARHNIPIVSYLLLRAKCANCRARIPPHYFFVELLGSVLLVAAVLRFGPGLQAAAAYLFLCTLLVASKIDIDHLVLPDILVLPLIWVGLLVNLDSFFAPTREAVLGAVVGYMILFTVHRVAFMVTGRDMVGQGDFKLLAAAGAWLGVVALPYVLFIGSSLVVAAAGMDAVFNRKRQELFPFGPALAAGAVVMLFFGGDIHYGFLAYIGR